MHRAARLKPVVIDESNELRKLTLSVAPPRLTVFPAPVAVAN